MTDDPLNQHDPASLPAPSGVPQPEGSPGRRKFIIAGVVIALIVFVVIALPLIVVVFQWISALVFGPPGACECIKIDVRTEVSQPVNSTIIVTYQGGKGEQLVDSMTATITDSTGHMQSKTVENKRPFALKDYLWFWDLIFPPHGYPKIYSLPVGENITFDGAFSGRDHVVVNAHSWDDGGEIGIYDSYI